MGTNQRGAAPDGLTTSAPDRPARATGGSRDRRIETQMCRFEVLAGSDAGDVYEESDDVLPMLLLISAAPARVTRPEGGSARRPV